MDSKVAYGNTGGGKLVPFAVTDDGRLIISTGAGQYPEVTNFAALPDATIHIGEIYVVLNPTGVIWVNRKKAGLYIAEGPTATDWRYLGAQAENFNDANFNIYNGSDNTKRLVADASTQTTGTDGTLAVKTGEVGGSTFTGGVATGEDLTLLSNAIDGKGIFITASNNRAHAKGLDYFVDNNCSLSSFESGGAVRALARLTNANILHLGDSQPRIRLRAGSTNALDFNFTTGKFELNGNSIDMDFEFNKLTSGIWLQYDAGTDVLTLQGNTYPSNVGVLGQYMGPDGTGNITFHDFPLTTGSVVYRASSTTTPPPNTGRLQWNNATQADATVLDINVINFNGVDVSVFFGTVAPGDYIRIQESDNVNVNQVWEVVSIVDNGTYFSFTVTNQQAIGGNIANNKDVLVTFATQASGSNPSIFGQHYTYDDSEAAEQTTNAIPPNLVNAFSHTTDVLPNGAYRFEVSFEWRRDATGNDFIAEFIINSVVQGGGFNEESKDPNSYHQFTVFRGNVVLSGINTVAIDFGGETAGATSYIRNIRVEYFRVT